MKRRQKDASVGDITSQLQPLVDDDAFLTELSRGVDPSDGTDELAALFLELRDDVEQQMPPAPLIEGADEEPEVVSLASRRGGRQGRPFLSGIIGAAAATLVIAGSGSLLYNATPDSPLWGVSSALFSDRATVVELAGALEEIDSRAAEGDIDGTRALLEEARRLLADATAERQAPQQAPRVTTTTVIPPVEPAPPVTQEPVTETVTETSVETETATATVTVTQTPPPVRPNPLPSPVEPTPAPSPTDPATTVPDTGTPDPDDQDPTTTLAPPQLQTP